MRAKYCQPLPLALKHKKAPTKQVGAFLWEVQLDEKYLYKIFLDELRPKMAQGGGQPRNGADVAEGFRFHGLVVVDAFFAVAGLGTGLVAEHAHVGIAQDAQAGDGAQGIEGKEAEQGGLLGVAQRRAGQQVQHFGGLGGLLQAHGRRGQGAHGLDAGDGAPAGIVEAQGAQPLGQLGGALQLVGAVVDVELLLGREARVADDDGQNGVP
jgi:hypothetical protein